MSDDSCPVINDSSVTGACLGMNDSQVKITNIAQGEGKVTDT